MPLSVVCSNSDFVCILGAPHELASNTCVYVCIHKHTPKNMFEFPKVFYVWPLSQTFFFIVLLFAAVFMCSCLVVHISGWLSGWLTRHERLEHTATPEAHQKHSVYYICTKRTKNKNRPRT